MNSPGFIERSLYAHAQADMWAAIERMERVDRQLDAVRALHARVSDDSGHYCDSCMNGWGEPMRWPCPTIRTLDNAPVDSMGDAR